MEPMRVYGPNVVESFLSSFLSLLAPALTLFGLALVFTALWWEGSWFAGDFGGGLLAVTTMVAGLVLGLAASGLRQNRAALDLGFALLFVCGVGWIVATIVDFKVGSLAVGLMILAAFWFAKFLRREGLRARYKPRFLSLRQFETMVQIVDTMIEADGGAAVHPVEAAISVDHLLAEVQEAASGCRGNSRRARRAAEKDAPVLSDVRQLMFFTEWLLPLWALRPYPFSGLGSFERRRAVERARDFRWLPVLRDVLHDIVRTVKTGACVGYYGIPEAMEQIGYVPYEERVGARAAEVVIVHKDPFP